MGLDQSPSTRPQEITINYNGDLILLAIPLKKHSDKTLVTQIGAR